MKELRSSDLEDVMKVLIKKIESGDIESNVYSLLFVNELKNVKQEIKDRIMKTGD